MGKTEVAAPHAVEIMSLMHDEAEEVRVGVTRALGKMLQGGRAKACVSKLIDQLWDDSEHVRHATINTLVQLESATVTRIFQIAKLMNSSPRTTVRVAAASTIAKMSTDILIPQIGKLLPLLR